MFGCDTNQTKTAYLLPRLDPGPSGKHIQAARIALHAVIGRRKFDFGANIPPKYVLILYPCALFHAGVDETGMSASLLNAIEEVESGETRLKQNLELRNDAAFDRAIGLTHT